MALKNVKISQATPLTKQEIEGSILIPVYDGTTTPRSLSLSDYSETVLEKIETSPSLVKVETLENYYTKEEVDSIVAPDVSDLLTKINRIDGDEETEGSIKYQINMAKEDLIGESTDQSSYDTINAAKNLIAESLQFINYNN